jgi:hypothetical protein
MEVMTVESGSYQLLIGQTAVGTAMVYFLHQNVRTDSSRDSSSKGASAARALPRAFFPIRLRPTAGPTNNAR